MPASPELANAARAIRAVEVLGEAESDHASEADRHVGVAGKIVEDLHRVGEDPYPGIRRVRRGKAERGICNTGDAVGNQNLLREPDHEALCSGAELWKRVGSASQLRGNVPVANDRSGDELREEANVRRHVDVVPRRLGIPTPHIDQIAACLEDVEGDADRQHHLPSGHSATAEGRHEGADAIDAEVEVLEVGQRSNIENHAQKQGAAGASGCGHALRLDRAAEYVGPHSGKDHQEHEVQAPPSVEGETCR